MASIFNTLGMGYSGLNAAQVGINVTGNNITNAETEGYSRQRVVQSAQTPLITDAGNVGSGVKIEDITRIFDNFVYDRYTKTAADKEYTEFTQQTLEQLSTYFPEVDGVGIKADLAEYYNMWQSFADAPNNDAIKVALAEQTKTLSQHIAQTKLQASSMQSDLNDQLAANVNQVNDLAKQLADVNTSIDSAEAGGLHTASDLRDQRNLLEKDLARLIGSTAMRDQLSANIQIDTNSNIKTGSYTLSVNGFNIVDGNTYHPLHLSNDSNKNGFYELSYERQDGVLIPMDEAVKNGKIGAIFALRGGAIDNDTQVPVDGVVQNVIAKLDAFAKGLIESTNNLYAAATTSKKESNSLTVDGATTLTSSNLNIHEGSFDIVTYDIDGNEVARRAINIDSATSMSSGSNSIVEQIKANVDDNSDGNANNNVNNLINATYQAASDGTLRLELNLTALGESRGYTFNVEDNLSSDKFSSGTNFSGAIGLGRYFDGNNASNMTLNETLQKNPTKIQAGKNATAGDNRVALDMMQQQFESYDFQVDSTTSYNTTINGMFDIIATDVGIATNTAIGKNETTTTQFNAVELEYNSVSKVNIDEELTNLIKYQTSYGAAAKLISTVDQMMQTLLGIKQ